MQNKEIEHPLKSSRGMMIYRGLWVEKLIGLGYFIQSDFGPGTKVKTIQEVDEHIDRVYEGIKNSIVKPEN